MRVTAGTAVGSERLRELAERLGAATRAIRPAAMPADTAAAAGDPGLAAAVQRFGSAVARARAELDDDLARMRDALRLTADLYEEAELAVLDRLAGR